MIDASSFAINHLAFWADHAPTTEHFVRRINLEYADRYHAPIGKPLGSFRASFVAEIAFSRLCLRIMGVGEQQLPVESMIDAKRRLLPLLQNPTIIDEPLSAAESAQVCQLEQVLTGFFTGHGLPLFPRPLFSGCGYLNASEGDIIRNETLFEVKAVDRPFRGIDIRQIVTYCALSYISQGHSIERGGVFNPRRGTYFDVPIDQICREISGKSKEELFDKITYAISSGDISR